jgi:hypothetical protein
MTGLRQALIGVAASIALITGAQAADYREDAYGETETRYRAEALEPLPDFGPRYRTEGDWIERGPRYVKERRFLGRPMPEWGYAGRPVAMRPSWRHGEDCRLIVKRRVNPWGEVVIRRVRICE